jgi:hypothetical protein
VPRGERDGSLWPYSRFSRPEPLVFFQVAPQLYSRGWVDPVPDPLPRKPGSVGNRTRDLWIRSQEIWPLDYRGGRKVLLLRLYKSALAFQIQSESSFLTTTPARLKTLDFIGPVLEWYMSTRTLVTIPAYIACQASSVIQNRGLLVGRDKLRNPTISPPSPSSLNEKQWPQSASELYRPSVLRLSVKLVPTFSDRECPVISATDPYGRTLGFIDSIVIICSSYWITTVSSAICSSR